MTTRFNAGTLTEQNTSKTWEGNGWKIQYHEAGQGEPLILLHGYGPGSSGWLHYHKVLPELSKHFRCIIPDVGGTGKTVRPKNLGGGHEDIALTAVTLMDGLGIQKTNIAGFSSGGTSSLLFGYTYPDRVLKIVTGSCHHSRNQSYGGEPYMIANRPSEGNRSSVETTSNPTKENFERYLRVHIDDEELVTGELVDYVYSTYMNNPNRPKTPPPLRTRREAEVTGSHVSHLHQLPDILAPVLIIYGRYDRMCTYELGLTIHNYLQDPRMLLLANCGHWPPFEKPHEYATYVTAFLQQKEGFKPIKRVWV